MSEREIEYRKPATDWQTLAYWEGCGRGELVLQRCGDCGAVQRPATRRYGTAVRHSWLVGWLVLLGWLVEGSASVTLRYARPIIEITHPAFGEVLEDTAVSISARW